jgi:arylsulfatase A-like enzyme
LILANYNEAHAPYAARPPFSGGFTRGEKLPQTGPATASDPPEIVEYLMARYDEEILALDAALGDLLRTLEHRGILDRSWLVITSDHGEAFGEHGFTEHGTCLYSEVTRVPLILSPPRGVELRPISGAVSLLDVTATLSRVAGDMPLGVGRDLRDNDEARLAQVEFFGDRRKATDHGQLAAEPGRAVAIGTSRLIQHGPNLDLYFLDEDPKERDNRAGAHLETTRLLTRLLPRLAPEEKTHPGPDFSYDEKQQLKALGYIE